MQIHSRSLQMSRNTVCLILCTMAVSFSPAIAQRRTATFTSFDVPGATSTTPWGINADGAVVGIYVDSAAGKEHGFLLSGGTFTTIDYPSALATRLRGLNAQGDIVGFHIDTQGLPGNGNRGCLLHQGGLPDA